MPNSYRFLQDDNNGYKPFEMPGARPHYNPDRPGQVEHIALDLNLDLDAKTCAGTCTIRINPVCDGVERLTLDAVNQQIETVTVEGVEQAFDYDGERLVVRLQQPTIARRSFTLAIAYRLVQPERGLYFIGPEPHYPDKPVQVWTQGEDEDSRFWFPCFDYPGMLSTSEIRVRVPAQYQVVSNGELVGITEDNADKVYHWHQKQVHPTYLMALAVGEFDVIQDQWQDIPITYYVERGYADQGQITMGKTPRMVEFLSEKYGYRYAFPKYAQVCAADFIFGGMENTSVTILTDRCLLDERAALDNRNSEALVVHELAHQWFGDLLVINHWSHAWVKEGMATYSEALWTEHEYGADEAAYYRLGDARSYLSEDRSRYRRPMVTHIYREAIELYDRHIYEKGACVYHMIRAELGDDLFWRAVHTFVQDNAHRTVETIDLLRAIDKATGRNLRPLFDQYVLRGGHPDYKVAYSWDGDSQLAKLTVTQTQAKDGDTSSSSGLFDLRIPIGFGYVGSGGASSLEVKSFTVRIHEREQALFFPLEQKPDFISFDVGNHYLKTVELAHPVAELKAQLQYDPDPLSRIEAAIALAKKGNLEAVTALTTALTEDPFWGVRAEVAEQLASVKLDQAVEGLLRGLDDPEARVRRAVVEALGDIKTIQSYKALKGIVQAGDPSYYVEAAAIRSLGCVGAADLAGKSKQKKTLKLLENILQERQGWNETVRSGAIGALSQFKSSEAALDLVFQYTELGTPQALRLEAIRALGRIAKGQSQSNLERILDRLDAIAHEGFFLTQVSAVAALGSLETGRAIAILQSLADHTPDGRVRRRAQEAVQQVQKAIGKDKAVEKLRQELDELKKSNQELKSRLETLEAKAK
jgi:aminopeptidase N